MSRLLRRASSLVSLLPSCSCPIVSAASPLPLWLLITMIPVASHCCIALRLKSSVLVQCLAPLVPLRSHSRRCSAPRLRGGLAACVSARDGGRKVRGTRASSKVRGKCGIGAITRGPGSGGETLAPFGHTGVSGCGFGLHPLTAPRGAREAGDRSTLALASSCEAGSEAARPLVAPDGRPAQPIFIREKYPTDSRGHTLGGLATETAHGEE